MNRIYKVIWSKVKNCYVVVSEIAKRNSKSTVNSGFSVTRNILAGAVVLGLTAGVCAPVWAEAIMQGQDNIVVGNTGSAWGTGNFVAGLTTVDDELVDPSGRVYFLDNNKIVTLSAQGSDNQNHDYTLYKGTNGQPLALVDGVLRPVTYEQYNKKIQTWATTTDTIKTVDLSALANVKKYDNATAFGSGTMAQGNAATAFGTDTVAMDDNATAFGSGTMAQGNAATAFGQNTFADGLEATAFGSNTKALGGGATAFGHNTKAASYVTDENGYITTEDPNVFSTLDGKIA